MKSIEKLPIIDTSKVDLQRLNALIEERIKEIEEKKTELLAYMVLRGKILHDLEVKSNVEVE